MNKGIQDKDELEYQYRTYLDRVQTLQEACEQQTNLTEEEEQKRLKWWNYNNAGIVNEKAELPKKEIPIFDGEDITKYRPFIQNFKRTIGLKCESAADCLYYLEQFTAGAAKELVRSCRHNDAERAYEKALALLEEEYGNEQRTATAFLQKLHDWPIIKSEDSEVNTKVVNNLELYHMNETLQDIVPVVFAQEIWPFSEEDSPLPEDAAVDHLEDVPYQFITAKISMIIGMNRAEMLKPLEIVDGPHKAIYASRHRLGWALNGPTDRQPATGVSQCIRVSVKEYVDLESKIEQMYDLDYKDNHISEKEMSPNDLQWLNVMETSIKKTEEHQYEISLPLKKNLELPINRQQVFKMFLSQLKELEADQKLFSDYQDFTAMMLTNDYMEKVPDSELNNKSWYLSHHAVYHKQKNKIRVVFNCSLKFNGVSLNDILYQGPDLTNSLLGVILRFRQEPVAFMGDIEKMFYRVKGLRTRKIIYAFLGSTDQASQRNTVSLFMFSERRRAWRWRISPFAKPS
ncbi:hypothetical protein HAZT_HAZT006533 [Hyalella azteca]|uniref:Peptidase aspartic putative domain-containing protein n=1 Tax=Hyalella azteca TaxID=294128 RepID=A0A6A0GTL9_HYAAZ|nr:hypothetical protein HAZT_HAZT006533 [Hyalella azteca]